MEYLRTIWEHLSNFCTCLSCTEDINNQNLSNPNERTHLLGGESNQSPEIRRTNSEQFSHEISHNTPKRDDQNALSLLVQNTALNMIDVGAMDAHNLEHQEYNDRIKLYSQRLQQQWSNIQHPNKQQPIGLLKDVPSAEPYLVIPDPNLQSDLIQIRMALDKANSALCDVRVEHIDNIVVPFQIL